MEIQKLTEISEKVYKNLQALTPVDLKAIEDILAMETIKYGKIRTFDIEDSQIIILLTLKQNCLILVLYLLENEIGVPNKLLDQAIGLLGIKEKACQMPSTELQARIEKERISESITSLIIEILVVSKYSNQQLLEYLKNKRIPDNISVNLAVSFDSELELESFELSVLSKKLIGPVLLSLVKSYRNAFKKRIKSKILSEIKPYIFGKDKEIVFEIFYLINQEKHKDLLLKVKPESSDSYFGFMSSMVVDKESAELVYSRLEGYFDELESAMKMLVNLSKTERKMIQPKDEKTIVYLLECINKLAKYKCINFYKFISQFQELLKIKVSREIKGLIYEILSKYINDRDVYIEKIVECKDEVESEIRGRSFFLLPRLIRFLNSYKKKEQKELELKKIGVTAGSPYILEEEAINYGGDNRLNYGSTLNYGYSKETYGSDNRMYGSDKGIYGGDKEMFGYSKEMYGELRRDKFDCLTYSEQYDLRNLGFRSEDPNTIIECLDAYVTPDVIKLNSVHIRNTLIKDSRVIEKLIQFQIDHGYAIDDISIINIILCYPSPLFFDFFKLVRGFSFYLNGDFLERISDNLKEGIRWISLNYNRELGSFILRNSGYFNDIIKRNPKIQNDLIFIYEKIQDENLGAVDFKLFGLDCDEEYVFLLFDDQDFLVEPFFRIFSKQLLYLKYYKQEVELAPTLSRPYNSPFYETYVKAKAVVGFNVENDIEFLNKSIIPTDELLGYLKICGLFQNQRQNLSHSILLNFNIKDYAYVLKFFESASDLERFILFFSIGDVNKELDALLKSHIIKNLKSQNKLYLRMCILQLFKCKDLDSIIKILEKNFDEKELLFKLSIHNIITGGRYFPKALIDSVDDFLKYKALFLLFYLNIWDREYLLELINKADSEVSEEIKYLIEDIRNY